ncbi:hypothetical protein [uncultured Tateyamaria sp.]|uniref:hypothetical protein n=1 Tax=uncultured Tateyamaria sp. TaxID=455651 RepID=UPI002620CBFF|nr:hypothetical protein [uncultured Tateyamaria sp.]
MTDPFKLLGLNRATATEAEVKTAYAALLKTTRPEDDRAAFMALREAFTNARAIARGNDTRRAAQPAPEISEDRPEPAPTPVTPVKWTFHKHIGWRTADNAYGLLVKDTLEWMLGGGKDEDVFVAQVSERMIANEDIEEAHFRAELINYILAKGDTEHKGDHLPQWELFEITRPTWLNDTLMVVLANDLRLFESKPTDSYSARAYNVVLNLFQPVLDRANLAGDVPDPVDAAGLFAEEQNAYGKDDHGSHFDRAEMKWKDMSPVGTAMQDIDAAIQRGLWDLPDQIKAILARDELQVIDEYQDLDNRLRAKICEATGQHSSDGELVYPSWLTRKLLVLLDDTFGWSRHHGRHTWERHQFSWLHRVIARNRKIQGDAPAFRAAPDARFASHGARHRQPSESRGLWSIIYNKPMVLLAGYLGYRVLQIVLRLAT